MLVHHRDELVYSNIRYNVDPPFRPVSTQHASAYRASTLFSKYIPSYKMLSEKVAEKQSVTTRLTELILASEKQRDAKLNEIMKKMSADQKTGGASYPG